jgi:hypothetical protein
MENLDQGIEELKQKESEKKQVLSRQIKRKKTVVSKLNT